VGLVGLKARQVRLLIVVGASRNDGSKLGVNRFDEHVATNFA
jgi:hypothetical protein